MPRGPLIAVGALALCAVLGAGLVRLSGETIRAPDAPVAAERALRFEDRSDGSIAVIDAASGRVVDTVSGQAGFVRGTLRGLARERKRQGFGPEQPFMLLGRADGRLTLHDPTTGRMIDLESFGPVNAAEFARLLPAASARH
ncbi:photosynthetic complex assembly protein PuhC [Ramlibacter sp.]|uniref:photosynthetic complex assembly protein PuhC n=1 Tax=Ramlibacter sp. TaxID=1917967 RepID=UPI003D0ACF52